MANSQVWNILQFSNTMRRLQKDELKRLWWISALTVRDYASTES